MSVSAREKLELQPPRFSMALEHFLVNLPRLADLHIHTMNASGPFIPPRGAMPMVTD